MSGGGSGSVPGGLVKRLDEVCVGMYGQTTLPTRTKEATVTMATSEEIRIGELAIRFLLEGEQSAGALAMFEFDVPAGAKVPIAHSHDAYEETIYGLDGVLTWTVEGRRSEVGVGEALVIRRGAVHHFANLGSSDAKALAVVTPGILGPDYFR